MNSPIFSRPRFLPGSKINGAQIDHAVISDGCIINNARITHTIVGLRTIVEAGTQLNRVVLLGNDYYESQESVLQHERENQPRIGIGMNCRIETAIIDKNARRQARIGGPRALLHPRRHRHHPQERRHPPRHRHLNPVHRQDFRPTLAGQNFGRGAKSKHEPARFQLEDRRADAHRSVGGDCGSVCSCIDRFFASVLCSR